MKRPMILTAGFCRTFKPASAALAAFCIGIDIVTTDAASSDYSACTQRWIRQPTWRRSGAAQ
jgi:hypothetical protein